MFTIMIIITTKLIETNGRFHAVLSAYLSIAAGIVEASLSILAGHQEISMSLYGIALMAIVDVTGSVLVLMMWQCGSLERKYTERIREMRYSIFIGIMMLLLGCFLVADSIKNLYEHDSPDGNTIKGDIGAIFGFTCGSFLFCYKYFVSLVLDSPVIMADSISSLCSALTSLAAIMVIFVHNKIWWSDSMAGFTAALYTLYSGLETIISANRVISKLKLSRKESDSNLAEKQHTSLYQSTDSIIDVKVSGKVSGISMRSDGSFSGPQRRSFMSWLAGIFNNNNEYDRLPLSESEDGEEDLSFA